MKKVFTGILFTAFILAQLSCAKIPTAEKSNEARADSPAANNSILVVNNQSGSANNAVNGNVKAQETPLPAFTDAGQALAEGDKLFDANKNEKAIEAYRQAVKLNPDFAEAYFKLGVAYALVESEQKASSSPVKSSTPEKKSKKAKAKNAKEKDAPVIKTNSDRAFDNAVKSYKKVLAKNPKDDAAQYNLGRSYNKLNMDKEAEKALREAVKLKPDDSEYETELGAILIKLAHYEEAVGVLKKALKLDENNSQADELLEKAQAGQKRVEFGVNKIIQEQQSRP